MAGNQTLGTIRGTIEIDYDGAGIVKAVNDTDRLKSAGERVDKSTSRVLKTFGSFVRTAALMGASSLAVSGSLNLVAAAVAGIAALAPVAVAGLAALPGVFASLAAIQVIARVATLGMGDALKAATEDAKKFEEATKGLSPEAKKFAQAYRAAIPAVKAVQQSIQDAFFKGTAGQVSRVVSAVQSLRAQATGVSAAMGFLVKEVVSFATSGRSIENVRSILSGVNAFLLRIRGSIGPLVQAFLGLAGQFGQFGGTIGTTVNGALTRLTQIINGLDLKTLFAEAMPLIQSVKNFLTTLWTIASQLFSVFTVDGQSALGVVGQLATQLAAFLQSAQGQEALQAIGQAMSAISGAAGQVFLALLQALAPTIVALAPGVAQLAGQLAGVLVPAINALNPVLVALAGFLSQNMGWLGPLAGVVVAAAAAYKTYAAAVRLVAAVKALELGAHIRTAAAWVASTAATVANTAVTAANAAMRGGAFLASFVASTAAMVAQRVAMVAQLAVMGAIRAATLAWTAVQWALNAAMAANPLGLIIIAIIALVAGIVLLWTKSETFRTIVIAVWNAIKAAALAVVNWFMNTALPFLMSVWNGIVAGVRAMVNFVVSAFKLWLAGVKTYLNIIKSVFTAIWSGISAAVRLYINMVRTVVTTVVKAIVTAWRTYWNTVKAVASAVWNAIVSVVRGAISRVMSVINGIRNVISIVRNAFNSARSAASSALNSLISLVRGIPGRAAAALGNIGRLLYSKGRALIQGFVSGIKSMVGAAQNAVKSVVSGVTKFLPGSPAKEGPLSGRGYVLLRARRMMTDFAKGIKQTSQRPSAAMAGAVRPLVRPMVVKPRTTITEGSAGTRRDDIGRTFGPYNMTVDGKILSSFVIDAITGNPVAVAQANREGSRVSSFVSTSRG